MKNQGKGPETDVPCTDEYDKNIHNDHEHLKCRKKTFVVVHHRIKDDNSTHIDDIFGDWQKAKSQGFNSVQKVSDVCHSKIHN